MNESAPVVFVYNVNVARMTRIAKSMDESIEKHMMEAKERLRTGKYVAIAHRMGMS